MHFPYSLLKIIWTTNLLTVDIADRLSADKLDDSVHTALAALPVINCRLLGGLEIKWPAYTHYYNRPNVFFNFLRTSFQLYESRRSFVIPLKISNDVAFANFYWFFPKLLQKGRVKINFFFMWISSTFYWV